MIASRQLHADVPDELLRWALAPLAPQRLVRRQQMRAAVHVQAIGVGPAFVYTTPRVGPVVVDLTAEEMAADAPHVLVLAESHQILVILEHRVDVRHLEREMIQTRALVPDAEEHVVVDVLIATVAAIERSDDVVLTLDVHVIRADEAERVAEPLHRLFDLGRSHHAVADALDRRRRLRQAHEHPSPPQGFAARVHRIASDLDRLERLDAVYDLNLISVWFVQPHSLAAAGLVAV